MDDHRQRERLVQRVLRPGTMYRRTNATVLNTPDTHSEVLEEETTYRDPEGGIVTEQTFTPAYLSCGHFARNADQVGGRCAVCAGLVCPQCLHVCRACGAPVCSACSVPEQPSGARLCRACSTATARRERRGRVLSAIVGFFMAPKGDDPR